MLVGAVALVSILSVATVGVATGPWRTATQQRIVAVGDIHGAYEAFAELLRTAGLVDADLRWAAGDTVLVQTGDFTDRGPGVREVIDLLRRLEGEAAAVGGEVRVVLGNHEIMNLIGDYRDVSPEASAGFADEASNDRINDAWDAYEDAVLRRDPGWSQASRDVRRDVERDWRDKHPPGTLEYRAAFGPEGDYGRWLRSLPLTTRVGDFAFMHAGVSPGLSGWALEAINERVAAEIATFDAYRAYLVSEDRATTFGSFQQLIRGAMVDLGDLDWFEPGEGVIASPPPLPDTPLAEIDDERVRYEPLLRFDQWFLYTDDGPAWFRGFDTWDDAEDEAAVEAALEVLDARAVVAGHTVQPDGVRSRFGGRVFLIDTGMLRSVYAGRASALEIDGGTARAIYGDGTVEVLEAPAAPAASGHRPDSVRGTSLEAARHLSARGAQSAGARFFDPDGNRVPLQNDAEVLEFLAGAEVVSSETLDIGTTEPTRVVLQRGDVRLRAIFRDVDVERSQFRLRDGTFYMEFRDNALFEVAAYELSLLLQMDNVPPAIPYRFGRDDGSLQIWIEDSFTDTDRIDERLQPSDITAWFRARQAMHVFDYLIGNHDRNTGNVLYDRDWNVWLIDHTRTFQVARTLDAPENVQQCPRSLWNALLALDEETVRARLRDYLRPAEIGGIFRRRERLVEHIEALIEERGHEAVIFDDGSQAPE